MEQKTAVGNSRRALIPLGIAVAVGNVGLLGLIYVRFLPPDILKIATSAFSTAEASLLAIWIAFGNRPFPIRIALAVPGVAVILLPDFIVPLGAAEFPLGFRLVLRNSTITNGAIAFAFDTLLVLVVSIPLLAARIAGRRLVRSATYGDAKNRQPDQSPAQFTLRPMFGWTLSVAMVAGMVRLVLPLGRDGFFPSWSWSRP